MKRKIPALLLALLLVFSAALPAGAAGYRCAGPGRGRPTAGNSSSVTASASAAAIRRPALRRSRNSRPSRSSPPSRRSRLNRNSPLSRPAVHPYPAMSSRVAALVNAERAKYGLAALTLDETLCGYARVKSQDMHDQGYFSHTSPTYGSPFDMMRSFGVSYRSAGENIAMGYSTPEAVVAAWMNSEGHRANILSANYTTLGVGYVEDGGYWTQWFIG